MKCEIKGNSERFWPKVDVMGFEFCWDWLSHRTKDGYGAFDKRLDNGTYSTCLASRFAYEDTFGTMGQGLQVDHLCRNRLCCNPYHLEAITQQENIRRGEVRLVPIRRAENRFSCPHGHLYDEANTYIRPAGSRECRECRRIGLRKLYRKKKEENKWLKKQRACVTE